MARKKITEDELNECGKMALVVVRLAPCGDAWRFWHAFWVDAVAEGRLVSDEEIEEKERQQRAIESQKSQQYQLASVLQEDGSGWKVVGCASK